MDADNRRPSPMKLKKGRAFSSFRHGVSGAADKRNWTPLTYASGVENEFPATWLRQAPAWQQ